ncbi:MAG TPA: ROK family protein [Chloroflexota bacterium]|nr:ROK family protein [Chloroflexota bacterium]
MIDVGGTNVKLRDQHHRTPLKIPSGPSLTPRRMVADVRKAVDGWDFSVVSIGCPAPVTDGKLTEAPRNLGPGWVRFDFGKAFGCPVKVVNDAAMQALGSYEGGRMLFLGLGTGLGSALILGGSLAPTELAHLPYRRGRSYEDYVGLRGLQRMGKKRWRRHVFRVAEELKNALGAEYVVLGGGNAKLLGDLPPWARLGNNAHAFRGGVLLWR